MSARRAVFLATLIACLSMAVCAAICAETERITHFDATASVRSDGAVDVTERITFYAAREEIRRGLVRVVPMSRRGDERVSVDLLPGTKADGAPGVARSSVTAGAFQIELGTDELLERGLHSFEYTYRVYGVLRRHKDVDELYWNVTGSDWPFVIERATFKLALPGDASPRETRAYTGRDGEQGRAYITLHDGTIATSRALKPGEGMTVSCLWDKGLVADPKTTSFMDELTDEFGARHAILLLPIAIGAACFVLYLWRWVRGGKVQDNDASLTEMTPSLASFLKNGRWSRDAFTADLIHLDAIGGVVIDRAGTEVKLYRTGLLEDASREMSRLAGGEAVTAAASVLSECGDEIGTDVLAAAEQAHCAAARPWKRRYTRSADLMRIAFAVCIGAALFGGSAVSKWGDAWLDGVGMGAAAAIVTSGAVSVIMSRLKPDARSASTTGTFLRIAAGAAGAVALALLSDSWQQVPLLTLVTWAAFTVGAVAEAARDGSDTVQSVTLAASLAIFGAALSAPDMMLWALSLQLSVLLGVILERLWPYGTLEGIALCVALGRIERQMAAVGGAVSSRRRGLAYVFGRGESTLELGAAIGRAVERGTFRGSRHRPQKGAPHNDHQETDAMGGSGDGGSAGGGSGGGGGRGR